MQAKFSAPLESLLVLSPLQSADGPLSVQVRWIRSLRRIFGDHGRIVLVPIEMHGPYDVGGWRAMITASPAYLAIEANVPLQFLHRMVEVGQLDFAEGVRRLGLHRGEHFSVFSVAIDERHDERDLAAFHPTQNRIFMTH